MQSQLRDHMERLRRMRAEVVERTVRTQAQLEQGYLAHKRAIQEALQRSLAKLEDEVQSAVQCPEVADLVWSSLNKWK